MSEETKRQLERLLRAAQSVVDEHSHLAAVQSLRGALTTYWLSIKAEEDVEKLSEKDLRQLRDTASRGQNWPTSDRDGLDG